MEKEPKYFDNVTFNIGDVLVAKFKGDKPQPRIVCKTEMVGNLDDITYQVIFFEDSLKDFYVAYEYEPNDLEQCKEYNRLWAEIELQRKGKAKVVRPKTEVKKPMKFNLNQ